MKNEKVLTSLVCAVALMVLVVVGCAAPAAKPAPAVSTTSASAARDLTGEWSGTGTYYELDLWGNRVLRVTANVVMTLQETGNRVTGVLDVYPTRQEPTGQGAWVPAVEGHSSIDGEAVITTLTFYIGSKVSGMKEKWEFTFTSDLMSGHVTNLDDNTYLGRDSDAKAFSLMRRGSQAVAAPLPATEKTAEKATEKTTAKTPDQAPPSAPADVAPLPPGTPPKPSSLLATDAEYYLLCVTFDGWFGAGQFIVTYEKYRNEALVENRDWFWIGDVNDEGRRLYFDREGDRWKPRSIPGLPVETPPKPDSLLATDAEYYLLCVTFDGWFGAGQFIVTYEKYRGEALVENWDWFWIGNVDDESQRLYFDRSGDKWKPRTLPGPSTTQPAGEKTTSTAAQVWEIVDQNGQTAILNVDINGHFSGSGWAGSTASGRFDVPITDGMMSGTSMTFRADASYDGGQGTIKGTGKGTLNKEFPDATSASGVWSGTISDPLGTRSFSISWTATRKS